MNNLINKKYGKLTVLERGLTKRKDKHVYWKCLCECGKIISVRSTLLNTNKKTSCGCEQNYYQGKIIDLTNQYFGKLQALYPLNKRSGTHIMWHCKCECGKELDIDGHSLRQGLSQSCGCLKFSKGEQKIIKILTDNNISFEIEKRFESCRFPKTNSLLRFDFYINNQYLIEYDGIQHFKSTDSTDLNKIREYDEFKNNWCKNNNISLIRIPYTHYNNLSIKDLLLETSHFIEIKNI